MLTSLLEAYSIEKDLDEIEKIWDNFLSEIKKEKDYYIQKLEENYYAVYGWMFYLNVNEYKLPVQCYLVLYDDDNSYFAERYKLDELYSISTVAGACYWNNGVVCVQVNLPCKLQIIKRGRNANKKTIVISNKDEESLLRTFKHEMAHAYDKYILVNNNLSKQQHYQRDLSSLNPDEFNALSRNDRIALCSGLNILYFIWDSSEFNAQQHSELDILGDVKNDLLVLKYSDPEYNANSALNDLKRASDTVWEYMKEFVKEGLVSRSEAEQIDKMSLDAFKKYFLKKTDRLLSKFKEKSSKNLYNSIDNKKEKERIASEVFACFKSIISGSKKDLKYAPLSINIPIHWYSKNLGEYLETDVIIQTPLNSKSVYSLADVDSYINDVSVFVVNSVVKKQIDYKESIVRSILEELGNKRTKKLETLSIEFTNDFYYQIK